MQEEQSTQLLSNLKVTFGRPENLQNPPIELNFVAQIFSKQSENKKFNTAEYLGIQIKPTSFLFQFETKTDAQQVAELLNSFKNQSIDIQEQLKNGNLEINIIGKGEKVYIVILNQQLLSRFSQFNVDLGKDFDFQKNHQKIFQTHVKIGNSSQSLQKLMQTKGVLIALFDSMQATLAFKKSPLKVNFLAALFKEQPSVKLLSESFDHINLDLKLSSSSLLQNWPNLLEKHQDFKINHKFDVLKDKIKPKMQIYYFGEVYSITGQLKTDQMNLIFDFIFA